MPGFSLPWSRDVEDVTESLPWERDVPTPRSTVGFFYPPPNTSAIPPLPTDIPNNTTISSHDNVPTDAHALSLPRNSTLQVHEKAAQDTLPCLPPTTVFQTFILLLFFLPFPPLFSIIYAALGWAILRGHVPVRSFAEAGATGGIILALPLALAVWILLAPEKQSHREDFFDDDEPQTWWTRWGKFVPCGFMLVFVGVAACPLGAVCITQQDSRNLEAGKAALAALIGGVVFCGGLVVIFALGLLLYSQYVRRRK
ncbi:uncharacterized protein BT62DRAFT_627146 [Guyanagaster necrorhizus]|uniref:Uncharacterized protein n=1 Tax=Guyanagaster necrorhizus TaxID=856835 RepID=A0A9P7VH12_9AGAR|nr:uncharacterized protein BT62DRAFT_627146 [Guyanagaster necrorhizus MCA 3950]KAG7440412.1 hypothetical protein BT62DRAFT_627146 [Guyanagaster necrorhizus MCA 3950]